jgi:NAD(P)-dependent dehydrogenase (short-subunit alcohol dehydrogenase family)
LNAEQKEQIMSTNPSAALTEDSTIGAWLQHPAGSQVIAAFAEKAGMDAASLGMLRKLPLTRMLEATGSPEARGVAQQMLAQIAPANDGVPDTQGWVENITPGRFAGQTVIVTGAASGIGRAVASRVARESGTVVAVDLSQERLDVFAASLPDTVIRPVAADITDETAIARIVDATDGRIDGLANVAGLSDDFSAIHDVSDAMLERTFNVNVFGLIRLTRAVIPFMLKAGRGTVVNVASEAALRGSSSGLAYTASKHAVLGVTRSMAFMYEPNGIRVNSVAPGGTLTGMRPVIKSGYGPERIRSYNAPVPIALPENLAASICFLLSDDSANVNGAILTSDGGESVY